MRAYHTLAMTLVMAAATAQAGTVTVTTANDTIDINASTATLADLPGPDGKVSFSEAMIATNNTPGHDTVEFAIPPAEWTLQFAYPGRAVIRTTGGFYFRSFDDVTIDGSTQTAFSGDTNPDGAEVTIYGATLYINGDNSTLRGFDTCAIQLTGSNGIIEDCTGTMNITVFGGSGSTIRNNTGGTIKIDRSNDNIIIGNTVTRVRVLGWVGGGLPATNNRVGGPALADRNYITGYGTHDGEGYPSGSTIQIFDATDTLIENNWIGTTPDGLSSGSNASTAGIGFEGENHDTTIINNRIAGILGIGQGPHAVGYIAGSAIRIYGNGDGVTIQGNTIGLDANDNPILGSVTGIYLSNYFSGPPTDINIGGTGPGEGNTIAGHLIDGITVESPVTGAAIRGNAIFMNNGLGIDLRPASGTPGVTPNDALDADSGANNFQNFPVLTAASSDGSTTQVSGQLHSTPLTAFVIDLYASSECDASGHGQAERFLGSIDVSTDASGNAAFLQSVAAPAFAGEVIVATATDLVAHVTSEFSACEPVTVAPPACPGDSNGDLVVDFDDLNEVLANWNTSGGGGDVNGDGVTDFDDLNEVLTHWNQGC